MHSPIIQVFLLDQVFLLLSCVLYNLCNEFAVDHLGLYLFRDGPFDEIASFGGRQRNIDAAALAGDDFDYLHTLL